MHPREGTREHLRHPAPFQRSKLRANVAEILDPHRHGSELKNIRITRIRHEGYLSRESLKNTIKRRQSLCVSRRLTKRKTLNPQPDQARGIRKPHVYVLPQDVAAQQVFTECPVAFERSARRGKWRPPVNARAFPCIRRPCRQALAMWGEAGQSIMADLIVVYCATFRRR